MHVAFKGGKDKKEIIALKIIQDALYMNISFHSFFPTFHRKNIGSHST